MRRQWLVLTLVDFESLTDPTSSPPKLSEIAMNKHNFLASNSLNHPHPSLYRSPEILHSHLYIYEHLQLRQTPNQLTTSFYLSPVAKAHSYVIFFPTFIGGMQVTQKHLEPSSSVSLLHPVLISTNPNTSDFQPGFSQPLTTRHPLQQTTIPFSQPTLTSRRSSENSIHLYQSSNSSEEITKEKGAGYMVGSERYPFLGRDLRAAGNNLFLSSRIYSTAFFFCFLKALLARDFHVFFLLGVI